MHTTRLTLHRSRAPASDWFLRCLERSEPAQEAYPVPWESVRTGDTSLTVEARSFIHAGQDVLLQTRLWRVCKCGLRASLPMRVFPGDQVTIQRVGCGVCDPAAELWYLRWISSQVGELVWPFVW